MAFTKTICNLISTIWSPVSINFLESIHICRQMFCLVIFGFLTYLPYPKNLTSYVNVPLGKYSVVKLLSSRIHRNYTTLKKKHRFYIGFKFVQGSNVFCIFLFRTLAHLLLLPPTQKSNWWSAAERTNPTRISTLRATQT